MLLQRQIKFKRKTKTTTTKSSNCENDNILHQLLVKNQTKSYQSALTADFNNVTH